MSRVHATVDLLLFLMLTVAVLVLTFGCQEISIVANVPRDPFAKPVRESVYEYDLTPPLPNNQDTGESFWLLKHPEFWFGQDP